MDTTAIWLTLRLAACTTAVLFAVGPPLAYWLARAALVAVCRDAAVALPLLLPPTVLGYYLLTGMSPIARLAAHIMNTCRNFAAVFLRGLLLAR